MCPVQWRPPCPKQTSYPFMSCPPDQLLSIIEPPTHHACIALHFPPDIKGSVPCMGEGECRHHHLPIKVHAYTIALVYHPSTRSWRAMIVDLGFAEGELATCDHRGFMLKVGRQKAGDKRSPLVLRESSVLPQESAVLKAEPIDVRPQLMRRWGLFDEADLLAREPYYEQQRLEFPTDRQAEQAS